MQRTIWPNAIQHSLPLLMLAVCGCDALYRLDGLVVEGETPRFTVVTKSTDVDGQGKNLVPVAGARVRVIVSRSGKAQDYRPERESDYTNDQGRFDTQIWWGGLDCCFMSWDSVVIEKPGYKTLRIPADKLLKAGIEDHFFIELARDK